MERLLNHFSKPEEINHRITALGGATALHVAVLKLCPEAVILLLNAGADPDLTMDFPEGSLKVRELANGLNEGAIPPEAKERGQKEVERY